jgi:hypothetical protein
VTRLLHLLLSLAVVAALCAPAAAVASPAQVIHDCADDGRLSGRYSNADLRRALDGLPSDLDEYSDCREVIGAAIKGGSDKGDRGGGGGPGAVPPEEQAARDADARALQRIASARDGARAIDVGGRKIEPGSSGFFDIASASHGLPAALLLALIGLGLLTLAGGIVALRGRAPALARIPLLSKLPTPRVTLPRRRR